MTTTQPDRRRVNIGSVSVSLIEGGGTGALVGAGLGFAYALVLYPGFVAGEQVASFYSGLLGLGVGVVVGFVAGSALSALLLFTLLGLAWARPGRPHEMVAVAATTAGVTTGVLLVVWNAGNATPPAAGLLGAALTAAAVALLAGWRTRIAVQRWGLLPASPRPSALLRLGVASALVLIGGFLMAWSIGLPWN